MAKLHTSAVWLQFELEIPLSSMGPGIQLGPFRYQR